MERDFWLSRWAENRIGFHQSQPTPLLVEQWPALGIPAGATVFVPLAGKSLDMVWLAEQGYHVLGVELSGQACEQFFAALGAGQPARVETPQGIEWSVGNITLIQGDVFALTAARLAACSAVFDRAALIALPPELRIRYADEVYARLPPACRGLLIALEYPQHEKDGPPFAVLEAEIRELFTHNFEVEVLRRETVPADHPGFVGGVSALANVAYRLQRL